MIEIEFRKKEEEKMEMEKKNTSLEVNSYWKSPRWLCRTQSAGSDAATSEGTESKRITKSHKNDTRPSLQSEQKKIPTTISRHPTE
jgi:hypothetical protein